jgi:hypothetical protein
MNSVIAGSRPRTGDRNVNDFDGTGVRLLNPFTGLTQRTSLTASRR